jgi:acetyltransferase
MPTPHSIERLKTPVSDADLRSLAELLVDAVESGAAVSFMLPLSIRDAEAWWQKTISQPAQPGRESILLIARDSSGNIIGSVQLHPAWAPNQPHRADIAKLLVHRRAQRQGLGARLMHAVEQAARDAGFRLLTLDAKLGGVADTLYRKLGWTIVGTIPHFALDPDGKAMHDDIIFYKEIG